MNSTDQETVAPIQPPPNAAANQPPVPPAPHRATPAQTRRQAALLSFFRWAAVLTLLFVLITAGYYLYVNVINRPPAEVYVVSRGTAVSAVYGTVTITSLGQLGMFAQNSGYLHYGPGLFGSPANLNGQPVKKDQLLGTVVDEIGLRTLENARRDYEAATSRWKVGPASAGPLQSAQGKVDAINKLPPGVTPKVERDAAVNELERLKSQVAAEGLDLEHTKDTTESLLKSAEEQLKRTEIHAPFNGIMTIVNYNDGAYVTTNAALFTVAVPDTYVLGEVNEEDVGALKKDMKAEVRLYAYRNQTFDATLDAVLPAPIVNTSRYNVNLHLDKPPDNMLFGLTGEMNVILGRKPNAILVPARAVNIDQVLIVEDGIVEQRTVSVGFKGLEYMEILEGVAEGDQVIVSDQDAFKPGERVRAVKTNQGKAKVRL